MTTHHKDDCPCGSGKRYKHCHMAADQAKSRRGWMTAVGVVAALVVGVAAWGAITQWQAGRARSAAGGGAGDSLAARSGAGGAGGDVAGSSSPAPQGAFGGLVPGQNNQVPLPSAAAGRTMPGGGSAAVLPGENAIPWQYDVAKNRHYDPRPGHQHWHSGPPPSDTTMAVTTTGGSAPTVTVGGGTAGAGLVPRVTTTTSTMNTAGSEALAPGENPAPWEYDKARDRHFDPRNAHRHWHSGPPPPLSGRGN